MTDFVADDGKKYPISAAVAADLEAGFGSGWQDKPMNSDVAKGMLNRILRASEFREITDAERATVKAGDWVVNMNRALRWLDGRHPTDLFGPDATLCQVHGNTVYVDTCGCAISHAFDHHQRHDAEKRGVIPHHPRRVCADHAHHFDGTDRKHRDSFDRHHAEVLGENRHKNETTGALAEHLGVEPHEVVFRFEMRGIKRHLVLVHPKLADAAIKDAAVKAVRATVTRDFSLSHE